MEKIYDIVTPEGAIVKVAGLKSTDFKGKARCFNSEEEAFYYVRVLEIPTPRWTTYDSVIFNIELPYYIPKTHQERAYTSSIWYSPK